MMVDIAELERRYKTEIIPLLTKVAAVISEADPDLDVIGGVLGACTASLILSYDEQEQEERLRAFFFMVSGIIDGHRDHEHKAPVN